MQTDIYSSLFVAYQESSGFASVRKRAPQLLRAWRDQFTGARTGSKKVVASTQAAATPVALDDDFVVVTKDMLGTPGMSTPTVPVMYRPNGRVAAHLMKLAAANATPVLGTAGSAQGSESEGLGAAGSMAEMGTSSHVDAFADVKPERLKSYSENESFYMTTLCNDVSVDRGSFVIACCLGGGSVLHVYLGGLSFLPRRAAGGPVRV